MKEIALTFLLISFLAIGFLKPSMAQNKIKDSLFVRIDRLESSKRTYNIDKGRIVLISIDIKNQYNNTQGFHLRNGNSELLLKLKQPLGRKVVTYSQFNKLLNNSFLDITFYTKIFFILSEAKESYLGLEVTPILPEKLIKQ